MEWFFDGLGTELISIIIGVILGAVTGGTIGYKIGVNKQSMKQKQKAGTASKQKQIGESDKTIVLDEKNLNVNNIKIKQEQKAKDEASQMLCCDISYGYIFYGETRHRMKVEFTDEVREKVRKIFSEMHKYYEQRYTPKVKTSKKCNACSLKDICIPALNKKKSVSRYIDSIIAVEEKE